MRGYRALKQAGHLGRIAVVKQALTEQPLGLGQGHFSSFVMGCGAANGELVVRQYLLLMVGGLNLNRALLLAMGKEKAKVVFPLPKIWREVLVQHGFEVAHFRSALLWQFYVCAYLFYGVAKIGKVALTGVFSREKTVLGQKPYAYFADLGLGNLPQMIKDSLSHDVISWYLQWPCRKTNIDAVHHSVAHSSPITMGHIEVLQQNGPLPSLTGWEITIRFIIWGVFATIVAVLACMRGRWWYAVMLNQAASAAQVRVLPTDSLAREYLFHNSNWIYRPLWTYEAERLGSAISFYFYSTNCESFKRLNGPPPLAYGWRAMSWPNYLVWDEYQADFVRRAAGKHANISIVGPIWFQSSAVEMPMLAKPSVAVFDITPHRASRYCTLGMDSEFYIPAVVNSFLSDVSKASQRYGMAMLWKRKRNIGRIAHPHYRRLADQLADDDHVVLVEPDISAIRVIEASVAVISLPFTSTALIARDMGKPSAYYDPTGLLQRDDRAAHGIPIITGTAELDAWLSAQVAIQ